MKRILGLWVAILFLGTASFAAAKDYQVTGPVLDVKDNAITIKAEKFNETWEIERDKDTKTTGEIKKGDRVTIKYKMTATNIENKTKSKTSDKTKADTKTTEKKPETKTK